MPLQKNVWACLIGSATLHESDIAACAGWCVLSMHFLQVCTKIKRTHVHIFLHIWNPEILELYFPLLLRCLSEH